MAPFACVSKATTTTASGLGIGFARLPCKCLATRKSALATGKELIDASTFVGRLAGRHGHCPAHRFQPRRRGLDASVDCRGQWLNGAVQPSRIRRIGPMDERRRDHVVGYVQRWAEGAGWRLVRRVVGAGSTRSRTHECGVFSIAESRRRRALRRRRFKLSDAGAVDKLVAGQSRRPVKHRRAKRRPLRLFSAGPAPRHRRRRKGDDLRYPGS